jgi:hypothetical protein
MQARVLLLFNAVHAFHELDLSLAHGLDEELTVGRNLILYAQRAAHNFFARALNCDGRFIALSIGFLKVFSRR